MSFLQNNKQLVRKIDRRVGEDVSFLEHIPNYVQNAVPVRSEPKVG